MFYPRVVVIFDSRRGLPPMGERISTEEAVSLRGRTIAVRDSPTVFSTLPTHQKCSISQNRRTSDKVNLFLTSPYGYIHTLQQVWKRNH